MGCAAHGAVNRCSGMPDPYARVRWTQLPQKRRQDHTGLIFEQQIAGSKNPPHNDLVSPTHRRRCRGGSSSTLTSPGSRRYCTHRRWSRSSRVEDHGSWQPSRRHRRGHHLELRWIGVLCSLSRSCCRPNLSVRRRARLLGRWCRWPRKGCPGRECPRNRHPTPNRRPGGAGLKPKHWGFG